MRICIAPALVLALCGAAQAAIVVGVEASRAGIEAADQATFAAPADRVYGRASVSSIGGSFADVGTTDHGCNQQCASVGGAHAITEVDAGSVRWRVHTLASGPGSDAASRFLLTDRLVDRGLPDPLRLFEFDVRIDLGLFAERDSALAAGAGFDFGVYLPARDETGPSPLFEFFASADDVAGVGLTRHYRTTMFGAAPQEGSDVPTVFEATFAVPWFILATTDFEIEVSGHAAASADATGSALVSSYNSSWLGIRIDGEVAESANGYRYVGYVPGLAVPEPTILALVLIALATAAGTPARRMRRT